jgi:hypothetical protein
MRPLTGTDFGHQAGLSGLCPRPSWRQKRKDGRYNEKRQDVAPLVSSVL